MSRRLTATQALGLLRDILSDCSDGKQFNDNIKWLKRSLCSRRSGVQSPCRVISKDFKKRYSQPPCLALGI